MAKIGAFRRYIGIQEDSPKGKKGESEARSAKKEMVGQI